VSLAHNGVLFLDELPEFAPAVLNQLREPLEDGHLTVSRAAARLTFPASFMLVGAMNPCPCGMHGSNTTACECGDLSVQRYRARVSGPLLDRIDLHVHVPRVSFEQLVAKSEHEDSARARARTTAARELLGDVRRRSPAAAALTFLTADAERLLARAAERLALSARGVGRTASVARTVAALRGSESAAKDDVAEALQYRPLLGLEGGGGRAVDPARAVP
jgi:magnesium chelatase family protein